MSYSDEALRKWKEDANEFDRQREAATRERKAREREIAQRAAHSASESDAAFQARIQPIVEAIAESVSAAIAQRDETLRRQHDKIRDLELEIARLGTRLAELKTDRILNAAPGSAALLRAVN